MQFLTHFLLFSNMSKYTASDIDEELVKALDPTQDAQVVQWDKVTAHMEGEQITFVTGSATLVPRDAESSQDGIEEPIASSAEVVSSAMPSDCLAPMKEQPPRTPVQSPKKCGGFSQLRRSDSLVDPRNPFVQGCGGRLDFGPDSEAESSSAASASSESVLGKRSRTVEELEKELREAHAYAGRMVDKYLECLHNDYKRACISDKYYHERMRAEDATNRLLFSVIESFPAGPERADWLEENLADLRVWAKYINAEDELRPLLLDDNIHIGSADANADANADADADAN